MKDSGHSRISQGSRTRGCCGGLREQIRTRPSAGAHLDVDVEVADLGAYDAIFGTGKVA
jgi:hypothetical protein